MVFQAPRQAVALQQANLRTGVAAAIRLGQQSGDRSQGLDDANHKLFSILFFAISSPAFSVVRRFEGKTREDGVKHGQDAWAALRQKFDGCSREALRAAHRKMETVKMRSDEDPDVFFYKKDRCRDRLNYVTPKESLSDRRYEDIIL